MHVLKALLQFPFLIVQQLLVFAGNALALVAFLFKYALFFLLALVLAGGIGLQFSGVRDWALGHAMGYVKRNYGVELALSGLEFQEKVIFLRDVEVKQPIQAKAQDVRIGYDLADFAARVRDIHVRKVEIALDAEGLKRLQTKQTEPKGEPKGILTAAREGLKALYEADLPLASLSVGEAVVTYRQEGWEASSFLAGVKLHAEHGKLTSLALSAREGTLVKDGVVIEKAHGDISLNESYEINVEYSAAINNSIIAIDTNVNLMNNNVIIPVNIENARLSELLALTGQKAETDAVLSGTIRLTVSDDRLWFEDIQLRALKGGYIKMQDLPESFSGGQMELIRQVLANFHYERLSLAMSEEKGDHVRLELYGRNPDVYDGRRIELTVNLTGDLESLVQNSLKMMNLQDNIVKKLH